MRERTHPECAIMESAVTKHYSHCIHWSNIAIIDTATPSEPIFFLCKKITNCCFACWAAMILQYSSVYSPPCSILWLHYSTWLNASGTRCSKLHGWSLVSTSSLGHGASWGHCNALWTVSTLWTTILDVAHSWTSDKERRYVFWEYSCWGCFLVDKVRMIENWGMIWNLLLQ